MSINDDNDDKNVEIDDDDDDDSKNDANSDSHILLLTSVHVSIREAMSNPGGSILETVHVLSRFRSTDTQLFNEVQHWLYNLLRTCSIQIWHDDDDDDDDDDRR